MVDISRIAQIATEVVERQVIKDSPEQLSKSLQDGTIGEDVTKGTGTFEGQDRFTKALVPEDLNLEDNKSFSNESGDFSQRLLPPDDFNINRLKNKLSPDDLSETGRDYNNEVSEKSAAGEVPRKDVSKLDKIEQIERNREDGAKREELVHKELQQKFPEEEGYKIEREQYLRDKNGNIVKDHESGEGRRIDFTVSKDGKVVKSIEVTSEMAPKDAQVAKEDRIREAGGNFIKDRDTGQLVEIPKDTQTEVWRYT